MGLVLKREKIISFLKEKNCFDGSEKIIWANVKNAQSAYVVLVFNKTGCLTLPITPLGKIEGNIIYAESSDIKSITFKKGLIAYKLTIDSTTSDIPPFRVNKIMVGYIQQREELAELLSQYG